MASLFFRLPEEAKVTVIAGLTCDPEYLAKVAMHVPSVSPGTSASRNSLERPSSQGTRRPATIVAGPKKDIPRVPASSSRYFFHCGKSDEPNGSSPFRGIPFI